ncbi:MAG TPA: sugar ABC transporter ATP-binding protein [Chthoniobacterales bacterium]
MNSDLPSRAVQASKGSTEPPLTVSGLTKSYVGVKALREVSLTFLAGEAHAIAGQNGAGKSTLIRMLAGAEQPDAGSIKVLGAPMTFDTPQAAQRAGIVTIYQELSLVPRLSVAENVFMGDLPLKGGVVDRRTMRREAGRALEWLGFAIDVDAPVGSLGVAQQQAVELAKALHRSAKVILLDEPTATLPAPDVKRLIAVLKTLCERGVAVIYISHRFEELYEFCHRVSVLRDGALVGTYDLPGTEHSVLMRAMIGRALRTSILGRSLEESGERPRLGTGTASETLLSVKGLQDQSVLRDITFDLRRGEVLGVAGLVGSGQTELANCLFGAQERVAGQISLNGQALKLDSPRDAIRNGIGLLPQDRKHQGFVRHMSITHNMTLASLSGFSRYTILNKNKERDLAQEMIKTLVMRSVVPDKAVGTLSGGTQQKVIFAKWLASTAKILLFDEPTRGIDVGAKEEIYELMAQFVRQGGSVLMFTSELPEVMMSDRVLILARGRLVGSLKHEEIDAHGDAILNLFR